MTLLISRWFFRCLSLTLLIRYFMIALAVHLALLVGLGKIRVTIHLALPPPSPIGYFPRGDEPIPEPPMPIVSRIEGLITTDSASPLPSEPLTARRHTDEPGRIGPGMEPMGPLGGPNVDVGALAGPSAPEIIATSAGGSFDHISFPGDHGGLLAGRKNPGDPGVGTGFGKTSKTEGGVMAALRWLQQQQREDGSWKCGSSDQAGTALAVLAFLGHGETPDRSKEFSLTVNQGLEYLHKQVGDDGLVAGHNMYAQGLVALALSEGYAMTGSPWLRDRLERAVNAIVRAQAAVKANPAHAGGWRYSPESTDADL